jgi:hypothetical protein
MIENGLMEEFIDFKKSILEFKEKNQKGIDYMTAPIGYKQLDVLFKSINYSRPAEFKMDPKNTKLFQTFFKDFLGANRQYSSYQQDYCRKHLPEFQIIDITGSNSPDDPIMSTISSWLKGPSSSEPLSVGLDQDKHLADLSVMQKRQFEKELHKLYDVHSRLSSPELRSVEQRLRKVLHLQSYQGLSEPVF